MDRWQGKVAVVTGASSGIGLATAKALVSHGLTVVGFARRVDKMKNEMESVKGPGKFYARECDVAKEDEVIENLNWIKNTLGTINVLINNAGIVKYKKIEDASMLELEEVINVNLMGVLRTAKYVIPIMKSNENEAHIVNVNSILGHRLSITDPVNVYATTKFGITALTQTLSLELQDSKIRISCVSPGFVKTPMVAGCALENPDLLNHPAMDAEDVASAIVYALGAPSHVEICDVILKAKAFKS